MYKKCAERDGKIDCGEKVGMAINSFASGVMGIVDFAMLIWGSVVVFGAWANWTDNFDDYKRDPEKFNFCENTPMMTAFVILILKWVICPQDQVYNDDDDVSAGSDPRDDRHRLLLRLPVRLLLRNVRRRIKSAKSELILRDPESSTENIVS